MVDLWLKILQTGCPALKAHSRIMCGLTHTTYPCSTLMLWLHVKYNYFEIIMKLFQCFILHVTTSETEIILFQPPKEF